MLYAAAQARRMNPNNRVILLTDAPLTIDTIEIVPIQNYYATAQALEPFYHHHSQNSPWSEAICFLRWLVVQQFLEASGIERFIHIDSDVLLFCEPIGAFSVFNDYDFGISLVSGHTSFFSKQALDDFCRLFVSFYRDKEASIVSKVQRDIAAHVPTPTSPLFNISDMYFLEVFRKESALRCVELSEVHQAAGERYIFDHNINVSDNLFLMGDSIKQLEWINGAPYGILKECRSLVRLKSIHYQGPAKPHMKTHFEMTGNGATIA